MSDAARRPPCAAGLRSIPDALASSLQLHLPRRRTGTSATQCSAPRTRGRAQWPVDRSDTSGGSSGQ